MAKVQEHRKPKKKRGKSDEQMKKNKKYEIKNLNGISTLNAT